MAVSSKSFLNAQRKALTAEVEERRERAAENRAELSAFIEASEGGDDRFDDEGGEADTGAVVRDRLVMMIQNDEDAAEAAEEALARIEAGTYERCASCGEDIGRERLEAIPATTVCVTCKTGRPRGM
jgi:RNA polymerase-binding transcription factor DksA